MKEFLKNIFLGVAGSAATVGLCYLVMTPEVIWDDMHADAECKQDYFLEEDGCRHIYTYPSAQLSSGL